MEPKTCPHPTCGHIWTPRKANPKKCPQCQNPMWRSARPKKKSVEEQQVHVGYGWNGFRDGEAVFMLPQSPPPKPESIEKDSLSDAKACAEELFRRLTT